MEADLLGAAVTSALLVLLFAGPVQWHDGHRERQAWLDPLVVAQVQPSSESAAALRAVDPRAAVELPGARVSLWRLSGPNAAEVLASLETSQPGRFAPVFHDERGPASKLRVPAGGVLVRLSSAEQTAAFVARHRLVVSQDFGGGTLLVESAAGSATLLLAARLRAEAQVRAAMPNWWLRANRR